VAVIAYDRPAPPRSVVTNRLLIEIARDEGGDMLKAASGDPPSVLRKIRDDPRLLTPAKRSQAKAVWHSRRPLS